MKKHNCDLIGKVLSVEENPDGVELYVQVTRSGNKGEDILPVIVNRSNLKELNIEPEMNIEVLGVIRTIKIPNTQKTLLRVEGLEVSILNEEVAHKNRVYGRFFVKTSRPNRKTPQGYTVKDIILKRVLPEGLGVTEFRALLWNEKAEEYSSIENNTELYIVGRLQSREYSRKTEDGYNRVKTYEVSIGLVENDTDFYAEEVN